MAEPTPRGRAGPPRPCTTCGALIVFLTTREGKRMPVDAASVRSTDDTFDLTRGHRPHWASCPTAGRHRKAPKAGRDRRDQVQQVALFPLSDEELRAKGDELAGRIGEVERLQDQKEQQADKFNESIRKVKAEITQLAKEIRARQAEREATESEAPWEETLERAHDVTRRARRRRDRTGEVVEDGE